MEANTALRTYKHFTCESHASRSNYGSTCAPDKRLVTSADKSPTFLFLQILSASALLVSRFLLTSHTMASTPVWQEVLDEADDETVAAINQLQLQDLQTIESNAENAADTNAALARQLYEDEVNQ